MISGTPWPPSAAGGANAAAKPPHAAKPLQRTLRWVPAIILVLVCTTSFACVLLLVLGRTPPERTARVSGTLFWGTITTFLKLTYVLFFPDS